MPSTGVSVACTPRSRPLRTKPVRPCGVSDCGSSPETALALGFRRSSTIDSSSPRQTATEPQTFCAHSPAETVSSRESRFPISAVTASTSTTPTTAAMTHVHRPPRRHMLFPLRGQLVDNRDEKLPEALDCRDAHTLVGRVRELDLRAERQHVETAGHLAADDRGLEAGVHRRDD